MARNKRRSPLLRLADLVETGTGIVGLAVIAVLIVPAGLYWLVRLLIG